MKESSYLFKNVICPDGQTGKVFAENDDQTIVGVTRDNDNVIKYYKTSEVKIYKDMKREIKDFISELWFNVEYYLWCVPCDFFRNIGWFFKNLKRFWSVLVEYRTWDYEYCRKPFIKALEGLRDCLNDGHEVEVMRSKKVARIEELIDLIQYSPDDDDELEKKYIKHDFDYSGEMSEEDREAFRKEIDAHRDAVNKAEDKRLKRIYKILVGQSDKELDCSKEIEELKKSDKERYNELQKEGFFELFVEKFDGTGYKSWWD